MRPRYSGYIRSRVQKQFHSLIADFLCNLSKRPIFRQLPRLYRALIGVIPPPSNYAAKNSRLIKVYGKTDPKTLDDNLLCLMATIEDGLIKAGFEPSKDYTRKDLLHAAMPMVQKAYENDLLAFTTDWPNTEGEQR
jgi:hypothetical protein